MSPEHEKLFSLLCTIQAITVNIRVMNYALNRLAALAAIHVTTKLVYAEVGQQSRISLRVRCAVERIIEVSEHTSVMNADEVIKQVAAAAEWGAGKAPMLLQVPATTWQEQCTGRARLALRKEFKSLNF